MNLSAEQQTINPRVYLRIKRSKFLSLAPVILWILVILIPVIAAYNLFINSLQNQFVRDLGTARHQLITRAKEFESQLAENRLINIKFNLDDLYRAYYNNFATGSEEQLRQLPLIQALPDFSRSLPSQLENFSDYLARSHGFRPVYLLALDEDPQKCAYLLNHRLALPPERDSSFRNELARICEFFRHKSRFKDELPAEFKSLKDFKVFREIFGIFYSFNTHFYRFDNAFSGILNERIYQTVIRYPDKPGKSNYILIGLTFRQFSKRMLLKQACKNLSGDLIKVSFGRSSAADLPLFNQSADALQMVTELPFIFRSLQKNANYTAGLPQKVVACFSYSTSAQRKAMESSIKKGKIILFCFAAISLIFALLLSFQRLTLQSRLSRVMASAFFASMFFPISGLVWLGVSQSLIRQEIAPQQIMQIMTQKIREAESSFFLQRHRQQLLQANIARTLEAMPDSALNEHVKRFFIYKHTRAYRQHLNNFFLITSANKEWYRGQQASEGFRQNELPKVLGGPARRLMLQQGSFDKLAASERNKISQLADFSSGVLDQIIDDNFINELWQRPGEAIYSSLLARRDMFTAHFLKEKNNLKRIFIAGSENITLLELIEEMIMRGRFQSKFNLHGYNIELIFFPISEFHERALRGRVVYNENSRYFSIEKPYDLANALYASSDVNQINNLHKSSPHLIVTDTVFERNVFVFAVAVPEKTTMNNNSLPMLLALIALSCCMILSTGVSRLLLLPIPPFLRAINEIEKNNYSWNLVLKTGDEFEQLTDSVNEMKTRLLERQKMMQLVSRNAIEAARSDLNNQTEPQKRKATILFSDIRGFTTISENYSAEEVVEMLNRYFTLMCPAVEVNGGFIDKLIGDAIQAVFYGDNDKERVLSAARAALQMRRHLTEFNAQRQQAGLFTIKNGIGIASGMVTTGLVGSSTGKLEAAVIGEPLIMASNLESLSKYATKTQILLDSESNRMILPHAKLHESLINREDGTKQQIVELIRITDE